MTKAQESAEKLLTKSGTKRKASSSSSNNRPFGQGSSGYNRPTGGASYSSSRGRGSNYWKKGKETLFFSNKYFKKSSTVGFRHAKTCTPKSEKTFPGFTWKNKFRGRETKIFSAKLESTDLRPKHSGDSSRLETTHKRQTTSGEDACTDSNVQNRTDCGGHRNSVNATERSCKTSSRRTISVNHLCETQERAEQVSTNNKLEEPEPSHALYPFQDGGHEKCDGPSKSGGLYDQNRLEGCILAHSYSPLISKVPQVLLETKTVRDVSTSFWDRSRPTDIHKTDESSIVNLEASNGGHNSLLRRHVNFGPDKGGSNSGKGLSSLSFDAIRVHNQLGKVSTSTNPGSRIFGHDNKQCDHANMATRGKSTITTGPMSKNLKGEGIDFERVGKPDWQIALNSTSNFNGFTSNQRTSTGSDKSSEEVSELRRENHTVCTGTERTSVVDKQHHTGTRSSSETRQPRNGNLYRCFIPPGLGSFPGRGVINRGSVDKRGEGQQPYKRTGTHSSRVGYKNLPQKSETKVTAYIHGQYDSTPLFDSQGGHKESKNDRYFQENMGVPRETRNNDYCIMDSLKGEPEGGQEVSTEGQCQRMGTISEYIHPADKNLGTTRNGLFCIQSNEKAPKLYVPRSRPLLSSSQCTVSTMGEISIHIPTVLSDRKSVENNSCSINSESIDNSSIMARTTMVSSLTKNVHCPPSITSADLRLTKKPHGGNSPFDQK